jgi:hypothetical protein
VWHTSLGACCSFRSVSGADDVRLGAPKGRTPLPAGAASRVWMARRRPDLLRTAGSAATDPSAPALVSAASGGSCA